MLLGAEFCEGLQRQHEHARNPHGSSPGSRLLFESHVEICSELGEMVLGWGPELWLSRAGSPC